ncbi:hypothetical protein S40293_11603 [Stachybotrys chartarum IBT 40293]|nr:hypothetical protein S40293_11603 [Stachybotrys chartarum IBT 40293]
MEPFMPGEETGIIEDQDGIQPSTPLSPRPGGIGQH